MRHVNRAYFADWLDRTLSEREIPAGEVARALDVNDSAVSRWRNAKASPGLDSVMKLAEFLGANPIALAVTAGLMDSDQVGVEPLPIPEDSMAVQRARETIMKLSVRRDVRLALLKTLDERYQR